MSENIVKIGYTPKFSIITASYNSSSTIIKTIESILNQSFKSFEYIIIDGKSSDETLSIIERYEKQFNLNNIVYKYISEKDNGISSAFNKGIELSSGDFLLFLNSDDYFIDNFVLEKVSKFVFLKNVIYCGSIYSKGNKKIIKPFLSNINLNNEIMHPSTFIGRDVFSLVGNFDENFKIAMDFDFFQRSLESYVKFIIINVVVTYFDNNGISSKDINRVLTENRIIINRNYNLNIFLRIYYYLGSIRVKILKYLKLK